MWEDDDDIMDELEGLINKPFVMVRHNGLYMPAPLSKGDKIGIVSMSGYDSEEVIGAMSIIVSHGYVPVLSKAVQKSNMRDGLIPRGDRILELHKMLEDPEIKAIFCCGDGSGSIEILPNFSYGPIAGNPKWLVGHGDATAILSMWIVSDIASIHGPMCRDLTQHGPGTKALFDLLKTGGKMDYIFRRSGADRNGKAVGHLIGGNLSVLNILADTPYDLISHFDHHTSDKKDIILFFEDTDIPFNRIRDMLLRLNLNGTLLFVKGLIFGSFRGCKPYAHLCTIQDVVEELANRWMILPDIPIAFDFPIGRETANIPLVEGVKVELEVSDELVTLRSLNS